MDRSRITIACAFITSLALLNDQASAVVSFTVSGWTSKSHARHETFNRSSGSGKISFDLGRFFQLGFTHRQEFRSDQSLVQLEDESIAEHEESTHITGNSIDLSIILYHGQVFVPYIFGGLAVNKYVSSETGSDTNEYSSLVPIGGAGFGLKLNKNFMLKFFHTLSPGVKLRADGQEERLLDGYSQVGISYRI